MEFQLRWILFFQHQRKHAILYFVYSASSPATGLSVTEQKSCQEIIKIVGTAG